MSRQGPHRAGHHRGPASPRRAPGSRALAAWRRRAVGRMQRSRAATLTLIRRLPEETPRQPFAWTHEAAHRREIRAWWRAQGTRRHAGSPPRVTRTPAP